MTIKEALERVKNDSFPTDLWATMPDGVKREAVKFAYIETAERMTDYDCETREEYEEFQAEIADSLIPIYTRDRWEAFFFANLWNSNDIDHTAQGWVAEMSTTWDEVAECLLVTSLWAMYSNAFQALLGWAEDMVKEAEDMPATFGAFSE